MIMGEMKRENENYILNIATAVQINKKITPPLFSLIRSGLVDLNSCRFSCESLDATKRREVK